MGLTYSAHTCRIEKWLSVFCSSSDTLSDDISLTRKEKKKTIFPILVRSQFVLLIKKKIQRKFLVICHSSPSSKFGYQITKNT